MRQRFLPNPNASASTLYHFLRVVIVQRPVQFPDYRESITTPSTMSTAPTTTRQVSFSAWLGKK